MRLLVLSKTPSGGKDLLPALELLDHELAEADLSAAEAAPVHEVDVALVDATSDLSAASTVCRVLTSREDPPAVVVVAGEAQLAALKPTWGFDDWVLPTAQAAEVETRLRLAAAQAVEEAARPRTAHVGDLNIDETTYVVRLRGRPLDLTFREFELLKYLAHHPGRVYTREQLLQAVWGYDYFGGTRTVDVHIRRLRAKLGAEHESLIATVRGVGYKLDPHGPSRGEDSEGGVAPQRA